MVIRLSRFLGEGSIEVVQCVGIALKRIVRLTFSSAALVFTTVMYDFGCTFLIGVNLPSSAIGFDFSTSFGVCSLPFNPLVSFMLISCLFYLERILFMR